MDYKEWLLNYYTEQVVWTYWCKNIDARNLLKTYITIDVILFKIFLYLIILTIIYHRIFERRQVSDNDHTYLHYLNAIINAITFLLVVVQITYMETDEKRYFTYSYDYKIRYLLMNKHWNFPESTLVFPGVFGLIILALSIYAGMSLYTKLKDTQLLDSTLNCTLFYIINLLILIMITTNNLLIMFLIFEISFRQITSYINAKGSIDTAQPVEERGEGYIYKIYAYGTSRARNYSIHKFFITAVYDAFKKYHLFFIAPIGSIGILTALLYIYIKYGTLNYFFLSRVRFTKSEMIFFISIISFWLYGKTRIIYFYFLWLYDSIKPVPLSLSFLSTYLFISTLIIIFLISILAIALHTGLNRFSVF